MKPGHVFEHVADGNEVRPALPVVVRPQPGRHWTFSEDLAELVCNHIAQGWSMDAACREIGLPSRTAQHWLRAGAQGRKPYDFFYAAHATARETAAYKLLAEMADIRRRMLLPEFIDHPTMEEASGDPVQIRNPDWINPVTGRVVLDSLKWEAARMAPRLYGDARDRELEGQQRQQIEADSGPDVTEVYPEWLTQMIEGPEPER